MYFPSGQVVSANSEGRRGIIDSAMSDTATVAGKVVSSDSRIFVRDFTVFVDGTKKSLAELRSWYPPPCLARYPSLGQ